MAPECVRGVLAQNAPGRCTPVQVRSTQHNVHRQTVSPAVWVQVQKRGLTFCCKSKDGCSCSLGGGAATTRSEVSTCVAADVTGTTAHARHNVFVAVGVSVMGLR